MKSQWYDKEISTLDSDENARNVPRARDIATANDTQTGHITPIARRVKLSGYPGVGGRYSGDGGQR